MNEDFRQCLTVATQFKMTPQEAFETLSRYWFNMENQSIFVVTTAVSSKPSFYNHGSCMSVQNRYIYPSSPWENGYDERFNGTLRNEALNLEALFHPRNPISDETMGAEYHHIQPCPSGITLSTTQPETTSYSLIEDGA